jgi:MFS family permease
MDAQSAAKSDRAKLERRISGYFLAVTGATIVFMAITAVIMLLNGTASTVPFPERARQLAFLIGLLGLSCWIFAAVFAAIPFAVTCKIAERIEITHIIYFAVCGALTGALLAPIFIYLWPTWYTDPPEQPSLLTQFVRVSCLSVPAGIGGGLVYWWHAVRR